MQKISSCLRTVLCAAVLATFSSVALMPTPASAAWYHHGWGWHPGWHYGWHGCCWGPHVVVGVVPPVVYAPPPVVVGRVWVPPHWNGPYWVLGHWA